MDSVTKEQMQRIDEEVPEKYSITTSRLMENAGLQVAELVREKAEDRKISIYAGKGDNGGDALVSARRLHNWGFKVEVVLATTELDGIREEELEILENLDIEITAKSSDRNYPVALEGLIGYNLNGNPRPPFDSMIQEINSNYETVFSIDIPTGLDAETGKSFAPAVRPDHTVTLAAAFDTMSEQNSGEIWVADIGIPPEAYREFDKEIVFKEKSLIRFN
ncbi:NAD(P)H-hydrate epimerase [Candidatus Nanohaloarchaea archaeon]|nr:NAD(P)H-hydrate epimerase [Candidatus Nanohaloarchaea archaeon]